MNDKSEFVLRLIDRITAPARAMVRSLRALRDMQRSVRDATKGVKTGAEGAGRAVRKAGMEAAAGAKGFESAARAMDKATAARARTIARMNAIRTGGLAAALARNNTTQFGPVHRPHLAGVRGSFLPLGRAAKPAQALWDWNKAAGATLSKWGELRSAFMSTPFGYVLSGLGSLATGLFDLVKYAGMAVLKMGALAGVMGGVAAAALTKATVGLAMFAEQTRNAFGNVIGDKQLGVLAFEHARKVAKEFGLDVEDTIGSMVKLRSMQFSIREATELIKISADLQTISKDAQATKRAIIAITQIKAKGRLQSEELVGQLAEAGVSTVLVYEQLEKILKTDRAGVLKKLQAGAIDADTGIAAIQAAIMEKLHIHKAGEAGKRFANETLTGLFNQLKAAPGQFGLDLERIIDTGPVRESIKAILAAFDGIDRSAVGGFVGAMIQGFAKMVPAVLAFADGFVGSLGKITDALSFGEEDVTGFARSAGAGLAEFFADAITFARKLIPIVAEAGKGFFEGLDIGGFVNDMKAANWKQIGMDIRLVATAIGSLVHNFARLATLLGGVVPDITSGVETTSSGGVTKKDVGGVAGFILNDLLGLDTFERKPPPQSRLGAGSQNTTNLSASNWNFYVQGGDAEDTAERVREKASNALEAFALRNVTYAQ
jgi:hypothetical protein